MKNVKVIEYPNTARDCEQNKFMVGKGCDEIKYINKGGEMGFIAWFQIIKDNKIVAEIKESVCNIYGDDKIEKPEIDI